MEPRLPEPKETKEEKLQTKTIVSFLIALVPPLRVILLIDSYKELTLFLGSRLILFGLVFLFFNGINGALEQTLVPDLKNPYFLIAVSSIAAVIIAIVYGPAKTVNHFLTKGFNSQTTSSHGYLIIWLIGICAFLMPFAILIISEVLLATNNFIFYTLDVLFALFCMIAKY
jgi:hypothetical protein